MVNRALCFFFFGVAGFFFLGLAACAPTVEERVVEPPAPAPRATSTTAQPIEAKPDDAQPLEVPRPSEPERPAPKPCPNDMAFVDTVHCPEARSTCLEKSRNQPNNLTICHRFSPGQTCQVEARRQRFCIDRYEYPNVEDAHPPVMVTAYDAAGLCAEKGKRLCWESEWTAACEGPEKLPFPYGLARSSKACNIDNPYLHPDLDKVHHHRDDVRGPELLRLDQSVLSGGRPACKSGFDVYDLTGNFDEWVLTERHRGKGGWAGLKGGAWGHVRNACRPITTSHVPHWSYYFISFRCCRDADATALASVPAAPPLWSPPPTPTPKHPAGHPIDRGWTPAPDALRPNAPR